MNYPLSLNFKLWSVSTQVLVKDGLGNTVCFVHKKWFKLKEQLVVYRDESKAQVFCNINADSIIDFSASYNFSDATGNFLGGVRRRGMRSLWKAHYELYNENRQQTMLLEEENPMVKLMDGLVGDVPVLGMFSGYLFNPKYVIKDNSGQPIVRITKQPSFWEASFKIEALVQGIDPVDELRILLSTLMMIFLERQRG